MTSSMQSLHENDRTKAATESDEPYEHSVIMYDERPNELVAAEKIDLSRATHKHIYTFHK